MSTFCRLAVVLCLILAGLSSPAAAVADQEPTTGPANPAGQTQAAPAPSESAPAEAQTVQEKPPAPNKGTAGSTTAARKRRKRPPPVPDGAPKKIVVREGGASEPDAQIEPDITPEEAARKRQNAVQLLSSTDYELKRLTGRTLDAGQQETVGQIRNYMNGVRAALKEGNVGRANTLAEKAHLLADDLAKH